MGLSLRKQSTPGPSPPPGPSSHPRCQSRKEGGLPQSRPGRSLTDKGFFYPRVLGEEMEPPHSRQRPGLQPAYRGYSQMPWIRYRCPPPLATGPPLPRSLGLCPVPQPPSPWSLCSPSPVPFPPSGTFSERILSHLESLPCSGEGAPPLASELAPPTPPRLSEGPLTQLSA